MKSNKLFWGILLISVGIVWMLKTTGVVNFNLLNFLSLWPLVLVWIGINLIPVEEKWKTILNISVLFIGILFLLVGGNSRQCRAERVRDFILNNNFVEVIEETEFETDTTVSKTNSSIDFENVENVKLKFTASAGKIFFDTGDKLFEIKELNKKSGKIKVNKTISNNTVKIDAEIYPIKKKHNLKNSLNYNVSMNHKPVWDIDLELNATAGEIDFSPFKIQNLEIESNASALDFKLGNLYPDVKVKVETNASSVEISIPYNMKCLLERESTLSSFQVKGLKKQSNKSYFSDNKEETAGTVNIFVESNVSSVEIKRY